MTSTRLLCLCLATLTACAEEPPGIVLEAVVPDAGGDLSDEAAIRGLDYINRSGEASKATVLEANGAGVAVLDLEGDDDLDIVFGQGLASLAELRAGSGADLEVFLNDGSGRFQRAPGPGLSGWWTGLATGDVDGDGDTDLVAGGFGSLAVLLQNEHGRLVPAGDLLSRTAATIPPWVTSLALFDANRDGVLDLYVGQYLALDPENPPLGQLGEGPLAIPCRWKGQDVFCGPRGLEPQPDSILRGVGDGSFEDMSATWLPGHAPGFTLAVLPFDADGDGDTDLAVANDSSPNLLLVNTGRDDGRFVDHGYAAGVALSADGRPEAGMGLACGDVDRDGRFDLAVTNFSDEPTGLYLGAAVGFTNRTFRFGLSRETRRLLSWGVHLEDFDGDGWLELFTANGHVYPQADAPHTGTSYGQRDTLWHLGPEPRAVAVEPLSHHSLLASKSGTRGSAVGDFDGDGAPDLVLARIDGPAALGINRTSRGARLAVRCLGSAGAPQDATRRTPPDGMGTRVVVIASAKDKDFALIGEVQTAEGYQSASTPWLHFGLGAARSYKGLRIAWPSGRIEELPAGPAGERLWIREGEGVVRRESFR